MDAKGIAADLIINNPEGSVVKAEGYACANNSCNKDRDTVLKDHSNIKTELQSPVYSKIDRDVTPETGINLDMVNVHVKVETEDDSYINTSLDLNDRVVYKQESLEKILTNPIIISTNNINSQTSPNRSHRTVPDFFIPSMLTPQKRPYSYSYCNMLIKQEVEDINPLLDIKTEIDEETMDSSSGDIEENGCTNSDCNLLTPCLQKHKCSKCNLIFTEREILLDHFKKCLSNNDATVMPVIRNTISLATQTADSDNEYENSHNLKKLIAAVKKNCCLYDAQSEDYNSPLKDAIWSNIASECNFPNASATKTAWKKLTVAFNHSLNHRHTGKQVEPWKYRKQMEFMMPYLIRKETPNNTQHKRSINEVTNTAENATDKARQSDVALVQQRVSTAKKQKIIPNNETLINQKNKESQTKIWNRSRETKPRTTTSGGQPLDMFFLSMCATTKNLPPHIQLQVKKKVFQAVIEAEETAAVDSLNNLPGASSSTDNQPYASVAACSTLIENSSSSQDE